MILITFVWLLKKEGGIVMKNLVVLTGAGMSAESGISTFRDAGGLWDKYPVEQVATPEGYQRDPALVINFYNERRKQLLEVKPNRGHELLAELEKSFHVTVVTQNVDNLHERAGSSHIIHLHGELTKVCSSRDPYNPQFIKELKPEEYEVKMGDKAGTALNYDLSLYGLEKLCRKLKQLSAMWRKRIFSSLSVHRLMYILRRGCFIMYREEQRCI